MINWKNWFSKQASWKEKIYTSLGAFFIILFLMLITMQISAQSTLFLPVIAPMGASTLLLTVAPHTRMAQPWPIVGGHLVSATVGVFCSLWINYPPLSAALAVGFAIFIMHNLKCLHAPAAATALITTLSKNEIQSLGWQFCYQVVLLNVLILLTIAVVFHYSPLGKSYPRKKIKSR